MDHQLMTKLTFCLGHGAHVWYVAKPLYMVLISILKSFN